MAKKKKPRIGYDSSNVPSGPGFIRRGAGVVGRVQQQQIRQRQRTKRELQGKYNQYRYAAEAIVKKVGHIPAKGTPEYKQWKNYTNAVKTVERMAAKQGFRLK